jgi:hypothetical protein
MFQKCLDSSSLTGGTDRQDENVMVVEYSEVTDRYEDLQDEDQHPASSNLAPTLGLFERRIRALT